ncbi:MAG: MoaD/ThiS family protein [Promethearchaeota archaeon]
MWCLNQLKINITTIGLLTHYLPNGQDIIEGHNFTVQGVLNALVSKHGNAIAKELFKNGQIKDELSLLVNGRNVLSLPEKFQTKLKDKDEIIITIFITGG